jgi:uncharacterized protein YndB with AHSA1/START domain
MTAPAIRFEASGDRELVLTHVVHAARELVFAAWTEPEHLPHWLGRENWTMTLCVSDPRPGGTRRFVWRGDDGTEMGVSGTYLQVTPPDGLVCTETYDGLPADTPPTVLTLRLTADGDRTAVAATIRYPDTRARDAALATDMRAGLTESLTRLRVHLDRPDPEEEPT